MCRTKTTSQEKRGSFGVEPSGGTIQRSWPLEGTGIGTMPCTCWSGEDLTAKMASVSAGAGMESVWPGMTRTRMSARMVGGKAPCPREPVETLDDPLPPLAGVRAVPARKRLDGSVFVRRRFEVGGDFAQGWNRDLLPRALRQQNEGQERNQSKRLRHPFHRSLS